MFRILRLSRSAWKWRSRYKAVRQSIFETPRQSIFKAPQQPNKIPPQATPVQAKPSSPQSTSKDLSDEAFNAISIGGLVLCCGLAGFLCMVESPVVRLAIMKARAQNTQIVDEPVRFVCVARGIVKDDRGNVYEAVEPEFGPGLGMRVITPVRRSAE